MSSRYKTLVIVLMVIGLTVAGVTLHLENASPPTRNGVLYDPIEDDPDLKSILRAADRETDQELKQVPRGMGFCHGYWKTKKRILKEKYGIDWRTPAEMNPGVAFD